MSDQTTSPAAGAAAEPATTPAPGALRGVMPLLSTVLATSAVMVVLGRANYLAFHTLAELFAIAVAWSVFLLVWNVRRTVRDDALVFLGVTYAFVGLLDLLHALSYQGMQVFFGVSSPNLATEFWVAARALEAPCLLAWAWLLGRRLHIGAAVLAVAVTTCALVCAIVTGVFPDCYVPGEGLTTFKVVAEYAIAATMVAAVVVLSRRRAYLHADTFRLMAWAIAVKVLAELAFTLYIDVLGYTNMIGHVLKVIGVTLVYVALVRLGLTRPYNVLLHEFKRRAAAFDALSSRWRAFLSNADWPMAVIDAQGVVCEINAAVVQALGIAREDILGRGVADLLPADAADRLQADIRAATAGGEPVTSVGRTGNGPGDHVFETTVFPIAAGDGPEMCGVIVRDITLRMAADARYAGVIETAMDGFWAVDLATGRITEANQAAADMLGYRLDEMDDLSIADVEMNESYEDVQRHLQLLGEKGFERFESRHRRRDGTAVDVEICASMRAGERDACVVFIRDISARKQADSLMAARVSLSQYAFDHTLPELLQFTLDEAERLTGSSIGFMHFMEEDQVTLSLQRWSTNTLKNMCTAEGSGQHYPISQAGVWADCIRERRPVIHNDYAALPTKRGMPPGHAVVTRELVVPVIRQDRVLAILGVGNKADEYNADDVRMVSQLADLAWDVAGSKRAQVELSETEDRYRSLFEHLQDPVLVVDGDTLAVVDANRAARARYSLGEGEQAIGNAIELHVQPERKPAAAMYREADADGRRVWTHRDREGNTFPVRISTGALTVRGHRQLVAIVRDVSAEMRAEREHEARTQHLTKLIGSISDVIAILDADHTIRFESPNVEARFGYAPDERLGRPVLSYIHADDREALRLVLAKIERVPGASEGLNLRVMHHDGAWRDVEAVVRNLQEDKQIRGILFNYRDVTDRRLAEERFRLAFQTSPDGIAITSVDGGVYVDVNQGFLELSGFSRDELIGRSSLDVGIWPTPAERRKLTEPLTTLGSARNIEISYGRKDGTVRTGLISASFISLAGVPHILTITRDITELRRAEEERLQLEFQLQQAQKLESVGRLAGGIAHDFNNLLTVISGNAELARLSLGEDHEVTAEIDMISRTAERAAALTGQLLAYSREQAAEPRPISLRDLVVSDIRLIQRMIGEEVELVTDCPASRHLVEADPVQMQQVLFNLCVNARDAMPGGGRVTVATRDVFGVDLVCGGCGERFRGDYTELSVRDTGQGIDPDHLSRIFDPFFTTKEVGKGTGMGLATALGIVTKARGHIMAASTPGRGTTFRVYLPHRQLRADAGEGAAGALPARGRGERILVVEDDHGVQTTIVSVLERFGYRVTMAHDPLAAVALLEQAATLPDLVLSDVVMPRMNGEQLLHEVRSRSWTMPFLFMSGYPADLLHGRRLLAPERPYLRKPVTPTDLLAAVRRELDAGAGAAH